MREMREINVLEMRHYNNIVNVIDNIEEVREHLRYNAVYVVDVGVIYDFNHLESIVKAIDNYKANKLGTSKRADREKVKKTLDSILMLKTLGNTDAEVMESLGVSQSTFYRYKKLLKEDGRL